MRLNIKHLITLIVLFGLHISAQASTQLDTYHDLQNLKSDVRAAYVYALIVDKDGRAHSKRNNRIDHIESVLHKIDNLEHLEKSHKDALSMAIRVYLRSAKNEAATYDVNLGSRTLSNGYSAYSELIEKIYAPIQTIQASSAISKKSIQVFTLLDKVAEAIEIHGERLIKTERSKTLTQSDLNTLCRNIEKNLKKVSNYPDAKSISRKITLKWQFIKTPVCQLNKTSAPFTITHYGTQLSDTLKEYAATHLIDTQK